MQPTTTEPRQKVMKTLGEYGCYFLSLVKLAENITGKRIDAVEAYGSALEKKRVDNDATMLNPAAFLSAMTEIRFDVKKAGGEYPTSPEEYEILLFENGSYKHFVLGYGNGEVFYDPLGNSNTVAKGKLIEKRIFFRR